MFPVDPPLQLVTVKSPRIYAGVPVRHSLSDEICQGFLTALLELPVEIFAEVCALLDPLDLRNLSISGHAFRTFLMSRDSRPIWAAARLQLYGPMPDPPNDMSEPQYVRLLFVPECYTCEARATMIDCFNQVKSCDDCFEKYHLCTEEAESLYTGLPVKHICNFLGSPMRKAMAQWRGDPSPRRPHHRSRLDPEYIRFLQETSNLDYEVGLIQRCLSIDQSAKAILKWMATADARQQRELRNCYRKRRQSILARMIKLGHEERDVRYDAAETLGLRYLPHEVTEEEWVVMSAAMEIAATKRKAKRLVSQELTDSDFDMYFESD